MLNHPWESCDSVLLKRTSRPLLRQTDVTEFGFTCFQAARYGITNTTFFATTGQSEDCLTLNIWTANIEASRSRPVFVYVHGGGFSEGASSQALYYGLELVKAHPDILVASINYRLNLFGFPNAPGLPEQNLGMRDLRFAIEWLHENIAEFGGDPEGMVAVGESAGSFLLTFYQYAYYNNPIVKGLVMQSATLSNGEVLLDNGTQWRQAVQATNCSSPNSTVDSEAECLRDIEPLTLLRTFSPYIANAGQYVAMTNPTADNVTVFPSGFYRNLTANGQLAKIPVLIDSNRNEMDTLVPSTPEGPYNETETAILTDKAFICPTSSQAAALSNASVPVWRYMYSGRMPFQQWYPWVGAFHGSEIALILGTQRYVQVRDLLSWEVSASAYMQNAWVSFVKDPYNGLTKLGWPKYDPQGETLVHLIPNSTTNVTFVRPQTLDTLCSLG